MTVSLVSIGFLYCSLFANIHTSWVLHGDCSVHTVPMQACAGQQLCTARSALYCVIAAEYFSFLQPKSNSHIREQQRYQLVSSAHGAPQQRIQELAQTWSLRFQWDSWGGAALRADLCLPTGGPAVMALPSCGCHRLCAAGVCTAGLGLGVPLSALTQVGDAGWPPASGCCCDALEAALSLLFMAA